MNRVVPPQNSPSRADEADVHLRYPIGAFRAPHVVSLEQRNAWIDEIDQLPQHLQESIAGLTPSQLDTAYRPDGWTVRQVVHHLADSHLNCYQRVRLALTENAPVIKPYDEQAWAELADAKSGPVDISLLLLRALHFRWTVLWRSLEEDQWQRSFVHPERGGQPLLHVAGLYAWHSRHHVAHIQNLRTRNGW